MEARDLDTIARRNAAVLTAAQAINGSVAPISIALGGLAGSYLLGADKSLATLPSTAFAVGSALGALPAAMLMRAVGRRLGFMAGAGVAVLGSLIAMLGLFQALFVVFALGLLFNGFSASFVQQYRFAAADAGTPAVRTKAISWVLAGGIASAVIGPQTIILLGDFFAPIAFAGPFLGAAVLAFIGIVVVGFFTDVSGGKSEAAEGPVDTGRPLGEIARQPRFIAAVFCAVCSYAMMTLVMTAAPLAMVYCGLSQNDAVLGIQWHVLAMYAPSFVTGRLIVRYGAPRIIALGLVLLAVCAAVGLSGISLAHFWGALVLLGLGWNLGFIGGTAMLTETYRPEEKSKVQGLNDFLVFGSVAVASFSSGKLIGIAGWAFINAVVFPVVVLCFVLLFWTATRLRRAAAGIS